MTKTDLIERLVDEYGEDRQEMKKMSKEELMELLNEYDDHSDLYPNGDEFDGSHQYD